RRAGGRNKLSAARQFVEIFDDHVGVDDDIAIIKDKRRQRLQRVYFGVFVVRLARDDGRRNEFDLVDQPELDRGDANLAGKRRGGREGEFHGESSKNTLAAIQSSLRAKRSNPSGRKGRMDCFVAALLAMTAARTWEVRASKGFTRR